MRGINTALRGLRHAVFREVARVAYESEDENIRGDIEAIPYIITPDEKPRYRESIYRERAIASERVRLAMGMSLRPENKPVHPTSGLSKSNIADKYYEPPLMQVIPSACEACEDNVYVVSDQCRGCVAHPCVSVCPKGAISIVNGRSVIDQSKCIKCGKCKSACPYDAIAHKTRPCAAACGIKAIKSDSQGRARIDNDMCVGCGQCMVACPFGAIADKSQIFQLIQSIRRGDKVVAAVAPAIVGQFGDNVGLGQIKAALLQLGFADMHEVAVGADVGAATEAHHYVEQVATGKLPFMLTSCCPAWAMLAKKQFPIMIDEISTALTPMVATARSIKQKDPEARVVFIGPCAAKKLEAGRESVRSDVDFVITFEELSGMFAARGVDFDVYAGEVYEPEATAAGRGYAAAGGVTKAITDCINEYYPGVEVKIEHADGLDECRKMLILAKAGKKNGCLIEGMGCPGGCIAGAGTCLPVDKAQVAVRKTVDSTEKKLPEKDLFEIELP
ncbi:MAG: 4Fe-4S dicluster domain-containing protein [Ruminococcaceae bacterium]|nr:4Fe-4S dicluster domain-containing protein [Oscillospiraceae bacterium]